MTCSTVFGLDVRSDEQIAVLEGARAKRTGRVLDVLVDRRRGVADWPAGGEMISVQRDREGSLVVRIDAHAQAGYRLSGPSYGRHILSPDGRRLRCVPERVRPEDWQRFLIGQVLPFAAAVNGLEVLHASAVRLAGRAIGLLGPCGAGKTSLALALCRAGAEFLADDVVALEQRHHALLAHPGTPAAGVARQEALRVGLALRDDRVLAVNERERLIRVAPCGRPTPLRAVLFLERTCGGPSEPCFRLTGDPRRLLGSTFNFVLAEPSRLERLLDVCASAARGTVARVTFGPACDPDRLAAAVVRWFESV